MKAENSTIGVTGATGHLGRLMIDALLARGVSPGEIVAAVRDPKKARTRRAVHRQRRLASPDRASDHAAARRGA